MDKVKEETKCEFYDDYECNAYYNIYPEPEDCQRDLCRTHKDCYYRQLKRLEQENEQYKEFVEYVKHICSERMTFENPNDDLKSCLDFIDRTFDDLLIRIKDLEIITGG